MIRSIPHNEDVTELVGPGCGWKAIVRAELRDPQSFAPPRFFVGTCSAVSAFLGPQWLVVAI